MPKGDEALRARIASGETMGADDALTPGYRGEVVRLMTIFVDTELAWAAGYADFINRAPGIRERVVAAGIVADKLGQAEDVLRLLEAFGVVPELYVRSHAWTARVDRTIDLGNRRVGEDKRLNVLYYPLEGWTDAVTMNALFGATTAFHLGELARCSYAPLAGAMQAIVAREAEHTRLAVEGLRQAVGRGDRASAQASLDYWYPRVAATFGRIGSDRFELYRAYGLRQHTNAEMLAMWRADVGTWLDDIGLAAPAIG